LAAPVRAFANWNEMPRHASKLQKHRIFLSYPAQENSCATESEFTMPEGLYRIWGQPNCVLVQYAGFDAAECEEFYCERGFSPTLDDLPWSEEYDDVKHVDQPSISRGSHLYIH
jgi:hypothetical protein